MVQVIPKKGLLVDDERHDVFYNGRRIERLAPKEYLILRELYEARGRVLARAVLGVRIWEKRFSEIDPRYVDQLVSRARIKLGARDVIETVTRFGYKIREEHHAR